MLQLDPISFNERQTVHEFRLYRDAVLHRFPAGERNHLVDCPIDLQAILPRRSFLDEGTNLVDHLGRSMAVLSNASERLPHLLQIRRSTIQPAQRCLRIGDRRGDRLVHFMGDRGGELPHRCNPMNMGELVLRVQARLFSPPALGHVDRGADEFDKIAGRVENRVAQCVDVFYCAVWVNGSVIQLEIRPFRNSALDPIPSPFAVLRMHAPGPVFPNRDTRSRIETKQAVVFLRGMDELSGRDVERPAACVAQPLRFPQIRLAPPQVFFGALASGNNPLAFALGRPWPVAMLNLDTHFFPVFDRLDPSTAYPHTCLQFGIGGHVGGDRDPGGVRRSFDLRAH